MNLRPNDLLDAMMAETAPPAVAVPSQPLRRNDLLDDVFLSIAERKEPPQAAAPTVDLLALPAAVPTKPPRWLQGFPCAWDEPDTPAARQAMRPPAVVAAAVPVTAQPPKPSQPTIKQAPLPALPPSNRKPPWLRQPKPNGEDIFLEKDATGRPRMPKRTPLSVLPDDYHREFILRRPAASRPDPGGKTSTVPLDPLPVPPKVTKAPEATASVPTAIPDNPSEQLFWDGKHWYHRCVRCGESETVIVLANHGQNPRREARPVFRTRVEQPIQHRLDCPCRGKF